MSAPVISRHRLPRPYRCGLVVLWLLPILLLLAAFWIGRGPGLHLFDPRLWLPLLLMGLPALYIWHEGVDVLPDGLRIRVHWPRYRSYAELDNWHLDTRQGRRLLTVWDRDNHKVLEVHSAHLTDLPRLLQSLKANLRPRSWPY
ncbi:MAG: hypothetical protein J0L63_12610 [Anaerolineae bacterium]|nr:hypothetical protein [Anaerolineae bacterium]